MAPYHVLRVRSRLKGLDVAHGLLHALHCLAHRGLPRRLAALRMRYEKEDILQGTLQGWWLASSAC